MGHIISKAIDLVFGKPEVNLLLLGLDGAGKTTIIYCSGLNEHIAPSPSVSYQNDVIKFKHITMKTWDLGGDDSGIQYHIIDDTMGLIFVVDSNDVDRIEDAKRMLHLLLEKDELRSAVLLVLANKQDLPDAIKPQDLAERLGLNSLIDRQWNITGTCATKGDGLYEGFDWLASQINQKS